MLRVDKNVEMGGAIGTFVYPKTNIDLYEDNNHRCRTWRI